MKSSVSAANLDRVLDADDAPRPYLAVKGKMVTSGYEYPRHRHRKAEIIFAAQGFVTCKAKERLWMVAPRCALWIPGGMEHSVRAVGYLELYVLYVDSGTAAALPTDCCTLSVSPLLRELMIEATRLPRLCDPTGPAGRLVQTMIDQVVAAPTERLYLPLPADERLRRIADALTHMPADRVTLADWAHRVGMSERTLCRLILAQTGMSFGRWRQQFQIMFALKRMAEGESVKSIALELGYMTASAFISMFKKTLGQSPARYYAHRGDLLPPAEEIDQAKPALSGGP